MRNASALVLLTGALLLSTAQAADDKLDCDNAIAQNDMNLCAAQSYDAADARLNRVYKRLVAKLDGNEIDQLRTAERAWIRYRDTECRLTVRANEGGSIYPLVWYGCLTEKTKVRTKELDAHLACLDGGGNDCSD